MGWVKTILRQNLMTVSWGPWALKEGAETQKSQEGSFGEKKMISFTSWQQQPGVQNKLEKAASTVTHTLLPKSQKLFIPQISTDKNFWKVHVSEAGVV